ncbi:MAG: integration host factor subunit beta [Gammaproteobacteria bacterium]|nr:integration host factor subunit beta [Gammaproteobacteria bacterium]
MTKSELIELLAQRQKHLSYKDVEFAVKVMIEHMAKTLAGGERIEIRGFGSFSLHYRPPRVGRNPKTGVSVPLSGKYVPHFKPGKELRERVNNSKAQIVVDDSPDEDDNEAMSAGRSNEIAGGSLIN